MTISLRGLGATLPCTKAYPDSITFGESLTCAFAPWTDRCMQLKEQADLQCAIYTGAIQPPPKPAAPGVPDEGLQPGLTTRTAQEIQDQIIASANAEYQQRVQAWIDQQAASADAADRANQEQCGMFTSWNGQAGSCLLDLTSPGFLLAAAAVAALMFFGKR